MGPMGAMQRAEPSLLCGRRCPRASQRGSGASHAPAQCLFRPNALRDGCTTGASGWGAVAQHEQLQPTTTEHGTLAGAAWDASRGSRRLHRLGAATPLPLGAGMQRRHALGHRPRGPSELQATRGGTTSSRVSARSFYFPDSVRDAADYGDASSSLSGLTDQTSALGTWWRSVAARDKLVLACTSCFMLSNMDKVNMTVAIIPMAQELGWSHGVSGLVQSAFFWGFLMAQLPGGYLSSKYGGQHTLPPSVALWSTATALLPLAAASNMPSLCLMRSAVGVGEAFAPSAIVDMLARTIPKEQRAGAVSTAFAGLHLGSMLGLILSPFLIERVGWRYLFLCYGLLGGVWFLGFKALLANVGRQEPEVLALLERAGQQPPQQQSASSTGSGRRTASSTAPAAAEHHVPYRAMLRSRPVQALMFTHLVHNWLNYTCLAWLPTFFSETLEVDLMHAAQTALLPPLAGVATASIAGRLADALIARGVPLSTVRKLAQCTAFLTPAALLSAVCMLAEKSSAAAAGAASAASAAAAAVDAAAAEAVAAVAAAPDASVDPALVVGCITLALGTSSFSLAGLYCTHQDLSPKYASAMLGLTNTAAALPGVFGVAAVGFMLDATGGSWEAALFAPSATLLCLGAAVYTLAGRNEAIDFDAADDTPFLFESRLAPLQRGVERLAGVAQRLRGRAAALLQRLQ